MVLSGHSQGSILVASAVLQLDDATAARTALLTYGCPLRRLYARFFPAYLGAAARDTASARVGGRWVNLWAPSDPVGGWAMTAAATPPDERLVDPVSLRRGPDGALPPVCGHSGFLLRPEYAAAVDALATYEPTDGYARETRRTDP
jgi:hypothetical protein